MIELMPMTSYCRVLSSSIKRVSVGEVQQGTGGFQISLDQHEPPGALEGPHRKGGLHTCHLVVIQLHRVDFTTTVSIILGIGPKTLTSSTRAFDPSG